jgi:hypothetical protein
MTIEVDLNIKKVTPYQFYLGVKVIIQRLAQLTNK